MFLCLSFVIMRCTATFAILCLAVLILLEHAQACFEGPLPKKKNGFIPRLPRSFCWNHLLAALCLRYRKKHTAPWIAEHPVVPMLSTTTLCNVASTRLLASAMMRCYAVLPWNIGASSMSMVLCCAQLKCVEIATPLCNAMQKARRFPRMQLTLFRSPPSLWSSRNFVLLLPLLQQTPWHSWSNMASCLLFKNYLKTHTQRFLTVAEPPHSPWKQKLNRLQLNINVS